MQKMPSQVRASTMPTLSSSPARRGCKPASHHEPSMIVHLPANVALAANPFSTPPLRRHKPSSVQSGVGRGRPVDAGSAKLGPTSDLWSSASFRPENSNIIAYRAAVAYEGVVKPDISSAVTGQLLFSETDQPQHKIGDAPSTTGLPHNLTPDAEVGSFMASSDVKPGDECDSSKPAKSDTSVRDQKSVSSLTQHPSDSVIVAASTASQHSHVCLLYIFVIYRNYVTYSLLCNNRSNVTTSFH